MMDAAERQDVIDRFHGLFYSEAKLHRTWWATSWMGATVYKSPTDLFLFADLIWRLRPHFIIETGTAEGGSALFYATLLDAIGHGRVITVDTNKAHPQLPAHKRIRYVCEMSSTAWEPPHGLPGPVMVVLDSDHARDHVLAELDLYAPLVTPGSYLVVEDTNVNGHPVNLEHGPGPREALDAWLPQHPGWKVDKQLSDRYLFSMHTWLRCVG